MPQNYRHTFFRMRITAEEFKKYYQGRAKYVITRAIDGRRIQFPASVIRQFLTHDGIKGEFQITYDENNKLKEIKKIG